MRTLLFILGVAFSAFSQAQYNHYYGSLHSHSGFSDGNKDSVTTGTSTPAQNFAYVKQSYHVDYWGISEHNHFLAGMKTPQYYHTGIASANAAIVDGTFVSLYGMEWGVISGGGHIITYGIDSLVGWDKQADNITNDYDIYCAKNDYTGYWNILNARPNSFSTLAHPQTGDYGNIVGTASNPLFDNAIVGCAIRSGSASSSTTTYTDNTPATSYEPFWQSLLAKGYHLGPNMDADNHYTNMGRHNRCRTGVLATSLSKANITDAFKQMRFYATEDWNAQPDFLVNGNVMGSILSTASNPSIQVNVSDADIAETFTSIQIWYGIPGSGTAPALLLQAINTNTLNYTHTISVGSKYYYYAKIFQADGDIIWTAPIWVTKIAALPNSLVNFQGKVKDNSAFLNWMVANAAVIKEFTIEKSSDGVNFLPIDSMQTGIGNTNTEFSYTDPNLAGGDWFYRILIKETNGNSYYSTIVHLFHKKPELFLVQVYPQPVKDKLHVQLIAKNSLSIQAKVYSMATGREMLQQKITVVSGLNPLVFPVANLVPGVYVLVLQKPHERLMEIKFTKL